MTTKKKAGINKYHVEAADNAKFLGAIEKTSHSIYLEDPAQMKESLMRVIHIVKMIYNVGPVNSMTTSALSLYYRDIDIATVNSCQFLAFHIFLSSSSFCISLLSICHHKVQELLLLDLLLLAGGFENFG